VRRTRSATDDVRPTSGSCAIACCSPDITVIASGVWHRAGAGRRVRSSASSCSGSAARRRAGRGRCGCFRTNRSSHRCYWSAADIPGWPRRRSRGSRHHPPGMGGHHHRQQPQEIAEPGGQRPLAGRRPAGGPDDAQREHKGHLQDHAAKIPEATPRPNWTSVGMPSRASAAKPLPAVPPAAIMTTPMRVVDSTTAARRS